EIHLRLAPGYKYKLKGWKVEGWEYGHNAPSGSMGVHGYDLKPNPELSRPTYQAYHGWIGRGVAGNITYTPILDDTYSISAMRGHGAKSASVDKDSYTYQSASTTVNLLSEAADGYTGEPSWSATIGGTRVDDQTTESAGVVNISKNDDGTYRATISQNVFGDLVFTATYDNCEAYEVSVTPKEENNVVSAQVEQSTTEPTVFKESEDSDVYKYRYNPKQKTNVVLNVASKPGYSNEAEWEIKVNGQTLENFDGIGTGEAETPIDTSTTIRSALHVPTVICSSQPISGQPGKYLAQIDAGFTGSIEFIPKFKPETYNLSATAGANASNASVEPQTYTFKPAGGNVSTVTLNADAASGYDKAKGSWEVWIKDGSTEGVDANGFKKLDVPEDGSGKVTKPVYSEADDNWTADINPGTYGEIDFRPSFTEGASFNITAAPATDTTIEGYDPNVDFAKIKAVNDVEVADSAAAVYAYSTTASTKVELTADP
ncbi:hypothetical protein, partial [Adlercreutzia murintestinalis]|uniref:hypothetical protein n=1 Tax=Adlercreutzia murintestinalis TaxID=2941325 RepID=UPI00203C2FE1